jgi:hypothetical protein
MSGMLDESLNISKAGGLRTYGLHWGTDANHDDGTVTNTNLGAATGIKVPYILTPVSFISMLMEIPRIMSEKRGTKELIEKGKAIGRILTINTDNLYHLSGYDLLKTTVRAAALQGYGYIRG